MKGNEWNWEEIEKIKWKENEIETRGNERKMEENKTQWKEKEKEMKRNERKWKKNENKTRTKWDPNLIKKTNDS